MLFTTDMSANGNAIKSGKDKALKAIREYMARVSPQVAEHLIIEAENSKEYNDFTGNTVTSYAVGIYNGGNLTDIVFDDNLREPLREKVKKREVVTLRETYDGRTDVTIVGQVNVTSETGLEFSEKFLQTVFPKGGTGIVMPTGTEYSTFLEKVRNLDVLTNAFNNAREVALNWYNKRKNEKGMV